jgi:hypothetical protein
MTLGAPSGHDGRVEDWVAVEVRSDSGASAYFVTWGRIQHAVDSRPLEELMLRAAHGFATGGPPVSARVCASLQEASTQLYFYEAMLKFAQQPIPYGEGYEAWRRERANAMEEGQEIYFLGLASQ